MPQAGYNNNTNQMAAPQRLNPRFIQQCNSWVHFKVRFTVLVMPTAVFPRQVSNAVLPLFVDEYS